MGKGDHIIIPKSILKRFIDDNSKKLSVLDLKSNLFFEKYPDEIYVKKDFYDNEVDKFIRDTCESIIGELFKIISNDNPIKRINKSYIEKMKNIFIIQQYRSPNVYGNEEIISGKVDINNYNNNLLIIKQYLENPKETIKKYKTLMDLEMYYTKLTPSFVILKNTQRHFIIPSLQFVYIVNDNTIILYPISPVCALLWIEEENTSKEYRIITDDAEVEIINQHAIYWELKKGFAKSIFGTSNEIRYIKDNIDLFII